MSFDRVSDNVYLLRVPHGGTTTGVILLRGEKNYLIDAAGTAKEVDAYILPALSELSLALSDIECVLCTHTHGDHIGGFYRLRQLGIKKIAAYTRSVPKILHPMTYNLDIRKAFPENSPPPSSTLVGTTVDLALEDGDVLDGRIELVATPGHDDDTVCIFDRETGALICGDSIQHHGTLVQGCGAYMYLGDYRTSMQKLLRIPAKTVVLGHPFLPHGDVITGEAQIRDFLCDALRTVEAYGAFVQKHYDGGERDLAVIATKLVEHIGGVLPTHLFLPLYTVREHVRELYNMQ